MKNKKVATSISNIIIISMLAILFCVTNHPVVIQSSLQNKPMPIYKGNSDVKQVSFMINVYWGTEYIERMLDIFDKYNFKTTFFVGGSWVERNYNMLKLISEKGHEIGNHGYLHKDHKNLSYQGNYDEISMTNKLVKNYIGKDIALFAPPSGSFCDNTLKASNNLNLKTIMWSKDTIDWRDKDSNVVFTRATKNLNNGDLILAHPTKHTLNALDRIFAYYKANGFRVVTVSENIKLAN